MRKTRFGAVSLLAFGLWGCGPAPGPVNTPPVPTVAPVATAAPTASVAAGPDLSPVAEPADIIALGRWRDPMATASNLASCAGVAPILVEVNARMGVNLVLQKYLQNAVDTRKLAGLIALDAPVDVVSSLDPGARVRVPLFAVAVGLTSLDGAKAAIAAPGQEAPEVGPGLYRLRGEHQVTCVVAASAGATPARLVCAPQEKTLIALAPYLARTAPSLDLGAADMHLEARIDTLRKRYGDSLLKQWRAFSGSIKAEYRTGDARFDSLLFDGATSAQEDVASLFGDLHRVTVEARSQGTGTCLHATAAVDLSSKTSWIAQALTDRPERSAPPPALYWLLPKSSQAAFYGRGVDPVRFAPVLGKAREILEAGLAAESFGTAADRKKVADLLALPFGKDTNVVVAHGAASAPLAASDAPDPRSSKGPQGKPAPAKSPSTSGKSQIPTAMWERFVGWTLIGADEGPAAMKKQLKAMVDAYKLASVQAGLKKELGASDAKMLPVVKAGAAPASLGAGADAVEISIPNVESPEPADPKAKGPRMMTLKLHILVMGDGNTSWMAIGASKDDLVEHLLQVKSGASATDQLGARVGLEALKSGKQMLGGFATAGLVSDKVGAIIRGISMLTPENVQGDDMKLMQSLFTLPNQGKTPLLVTANVSPEGTMTRIDTAMDVQQGTFEDAKALAIASYGFFSRMGLVP